MRADLHIHSHYSDGCCSPAEIFDRACKSGLEFISITDHDTVEHLSDCRKQAEKTGIEFLGGVEFSTSLGERDVHILGYAVDHNDPVLLKYLEKVRLRRVERAHQIIELLRHEDVIIPPEEISRMPDTRTIARPLIAELMIKYKYVGSIEEAFTCYLRSGSPAFVPYKLAEPAEAIRLINDCGGISVLAHPSLQAFKTLGAPLAEAGLMGVEAFRPRLTEYDSRQITAKALEMGLVLTGGSDWHYDTRLLKLGDFHLDRDRIGPFLDMVQDRVRAKHALDDQVG